MSDLFRKEVLDKQGHKLYGDVVLAAPLSHMVVAALLVLIFSGLIIFSIIGEYSRKERVFGYLTPDSGLIRIVPRQTGIVEEIYTDTGTVVTQNMPLFRIKLDTMSSDGVETAEELLEQNRKEYSDVEKALELIPKEYKLTKIRLEQQISSEQSQAGQIMLQIDLQKKVVKNQLEILEKFRSLLAEEAISSLEVSSQENQYYQSSLSLENLMSAQKTINSNIQDIKSQLELLPINQDKDISTAKSRLNSISQRITQVKSQGSYIVISPLDGRVASQTASRGEVVIGTKALATILPAGGQMEAELFVPTRAAGFMKVGQNVRLLYDAFPYQKYGFHEGRIASVSKTVLQPQDLPLPTAISEPVFLVRVTLEEQFVDVDDEAYPLQAGMTLSADIILEDRKIWEWVFEPILGAIK